MLLLVALAHATDGQVTMPLDAWSSLHPTPAIVRAPASVTHLQRRLVGRVDDGLLVGTLSHDVEVLSAGPVAVLPDDATVVGATVDGVAAPLTHSGGYHVPLGVGRHRLALELLQGQASDRSQRRVRLDLPPGGPTAFELTLPEADVDVQLAHGVVTSRREGLGTTTVSGWVDGTGTLDLSWERRTTHEATDARLETEAYALLELGGDLIRGRGQYRVDVATGEVDRITLELPDGVEITGVDGDEVLQWQHRDEKLIVLLRQVVDEGLELDVRYQYPARIDGPSALLLPLPEGSLRGALGVVAPIAHDVSLAEVAQAETLAPRDIPQDLVELSVDPLRAAVSFHEPPSAQASTTHRGEVLTSASRIDDLQGISQVMEDGAELGKLRLSVRNADRQVLSVTLPEGARLTHCFRDGAPLRPAADEATGDVLVPLTRSQRSAQQTYVVQPGDTLSAIASSNYGDANQWQAVAMANAMTNPSDLRVGQELRLPTVGDSDVQTFVLELGWERRTDPLGPLGTREVGLPQLDLEVMSATWHVYLPEHVETLSVDATLTQVSGVHQDLLSRAVDLVASTGVLGTNAWAGGGYESVLSKRRGYFEIEQRSQAATPVGTYPLVGQRLRFRGHLLGLEAPRATVRHCSAQVASTARWGVWGLAALLAGWLARRPRDRAAAAAGAVGLGLGAVTGHYLLGTYGSLVAGANLGLLFGLGTRLWPARRWPRRTEIFGAAAVAFGLMVVACASAPLGQLSLGAVLLATVWRTR